MRRLLVMLTAVAALALPACGEEEAKTASVSVSVTQPAKNRFALQGVRSLPAGPVEITYANRVRGKDQHDLQLVRVEGNHSASEVLKIVGQERGPTPEWLHGAGGVGTLNPGQTGTTTLVLKPGKYYALDTASEEGPPPATRGALASFQVTGEEKSADLPESTARVVGKDKGDDRYEFEASGLKAGENTLEFVNDSKEQLHHVVFFPLQPGKSAKDAENLFTAFERSGRPPKGPPPVDFESATGTAVLDQKTKEVTKVTLPKRGNYVLVCFLQDRDGKGKRHFAEGMVEQVRVQ